jgi:radical SAM protein with 4Fe4S-binding SPASM domain
MAIDVIGSLDEPSENQITWSRISVRGWVIPPKKFERIEVTVDGKNVAQIPIGSEKRQDVSAAYPSIPDAEDAGFATLVQLGRRESVHELVVSTVTAKETRELGRRRIVNSRSAITQPPELYSIGLISRCNLSCTFCPAHANTSDFAVEDNAINLSLLEAALSGLRHYSSSIRRVGLTGWGEPFMFSDIFRVADQVHEACPNARISVTTNGTMFSDSVIEQILDSHITDIAVSLDAGKSATFERMRKGADFGHVAARTRRLVTLRNHSGKQLPRISTNFVIMRSNVHELPDYVRVAASIGVDWIGTVHPHGLFESDKAEPIYTLPHTKRTEIVRDYQVFFLAAQDIARQANVPLHIPSLKPTRPTLDCSFQARRFPIIDPSGDVYPCCILQALGKSREASVSAMGRIQNKSLPEIWNSDRYLRFREAFYLGELPDSHCGNCPRYYNM